MRCTSDCNAVISLSIPDSDITEQEDIAFHKIENIKIIHYTFVALLIIEMIG